MAMRSELKTLSDLKIGPSLSDFSETLRIAQNLDVGRNELTIKHQRVAAKESLTEEQLWAYADDINWYAYHESFFIWHFCLWRLQAIFEGIIQTDYLSPKGSKLYVGLKSKLDALRSLDYIIKQSDYDELLEWAVLRNQLSHFPPPSHSPGPLKQDDIKRYHDLCLRICQELSTQKKSAA